MNKLKLFILLNLISLSVFSQDKTNTMLITHISTQTDIFTEPYNRAFNVYTAGFGYKGEKTSLLGNYNTGHLMITNVDGTIISFVDQFELDFYHKLTQKTNYWVNYAYSNSSNFPNHRVLTRVWYQLPSNYLISGGYNYYHTRDDINIHMTNFGIEKYMGSFWIEGRSLIFFKEPYTKYAWQLTSRIFWNDVNFFQLLLMTGAAPDEPWRNEEFPSLTSHTAMTSVSSYLGKSRHIQLKLGIGYSYEQYKYGPNILWRNRYVGNVGILFYIF